MTLNSTSHSERLRFFSPDSVFHDPELWLTCERMVHHLAQRLKRRLPAHVRLDDLVMAGQEGIWEAARTYDDSRGTPFLQYARRRARGAMLDELRRMGGRSESLRLRQAQAAYAAQRPAHGHAVSLDHEERYEWLIDDAARTPEEVVLKNAEVAALNRALNKLSAQEQLVLALVFVEGLHLTEVAQVLSLSRSRVQAVYSSAIKSLRGSMMRQQRGR
ncbi:MAG: sigma-70 family RNA polymerase sigma factor [Alicyclobacillus sp.]|nr:sigma-70 family RNA polymerase sigma factor [Alicyclobacillus sp.]